MAGAAEAARVLKETQKEKKKLLRAQTQLAKLKLQTQTANGKRQRGDAELWRWGVISAIHCDARYTTDERDDEEASNFCSECEVGYHAWCRACDSGSNIDAFQRLKDKIYTDWKESGDGTGVWHCPMCRVRLKRCPTRESKRPRIAASV